MEDEEKGESSPAGDKFEGKRPMFGSRGRPPMNNGGAVERTSYGGRDPTRDGNGYALLTLKEIKEILHLQPSDHLSMQLVTTLLTGTNFVYWSRSICRALGARSKLELLDGMLPEPSINC